MRGSGLKSAGKKAGVKRKRADAEALRLRMAGLCAKSEQCAFDIMTKLLKAGLPREEAEGILRFLEENNFISESRFAKAFAIDKVMFSGWGRMKVRIGLTAKRVSGSAITEALEDIDAGEYRDVLFRLAQSKARSLDMSGFEDRRKLYRYLASRGFESGLIVEVIREIVASEQ